ncbi:hypothetical protein SDC9_82892 [bioreactor metagenome]|uniref:Uncharacterized protein n=1 Tax=bioreactor metagenome TaxID=1076179 RepID=A0A644Z6P9_9ZZZZ
MSIESISIVISGISLLISLVIAFKDIWTARRNIIVTQTDDGRRSGFLKSFDGCIKSYSPDVPLNSEPNFYSVLLVDIIITNRSSLPISILEFSVPELGLDSFNSYSHTQNSFEITVNKTTTIEYGSPSPIKYLQPEFTLGPYTSDRGYIFFWSGLASDLDVDKKIRLKILTSRGVINKWVIVKNSYESIKKHSSVSLDENGKQYITLN